MTALCNRCELLWDACRPLDGQRCPLEVTTPEPTRTTAGPLRAAAAVVVDRRTLEAAICPIEVADLKDPS